MKKYEFTGETRNYYGKVLHQIRALRDFGDVKAGEIGGWIEKEENLSHAGEAWVYDNAIVFDNAEVRDYAVVSGNAEVRDYAVVSGNAEVRDYAVVRGNAEVRGNAVVFENAEVRGSAKVRGDAEVRYYAQVFSTNHVLVVGPIGSRNDSTTFFRDKDGGITVKCGCFLGTIEKFLEKVESTHGNSKYALVYKTAVELAKIQIDLGDNDCID